MPAPCGPGLISIKVTEIESPGIAPFTAMGPVALLILDKSNFSNVSLSLCT